MTRQANSATMLDAARIAPLVESHALCIDPAPEFQDCDKAAPCCPRGPSFASENGRGGGLYSVESRCLELLLSSTLLHLKRLLNCRSLGLWLYDDRTHAMTLDLTLDDAGELGEPEADHPVARNPISAVHLPAWSALQRCPEPLLIDMETRTDAPFREWYLRRGYRSALVIPMIEEGETMGWIVARSDRADPYSAGQLAASKDLANRAALAVRMARIAEHCRKAAVHNERQRIAREVHDTLAQGFAGIVLQLEAATLTLERNLAAARGSIDAAKTLARQNLTEARRTVWSLRQSDHRRLSDLLVEALNAVGRGAPLSPKLSVQGSIRTLPEEIEHDLLRIGVEAVTNAIKHANASSIDVTLLYGASGLRLSVVDDGAGFDPAAVPQGSFGLTGMRERAKRIGARFRIDAARGYGARIVVTAPYSRLGGALVDE